MSYSDVLVKTMGYILIAISLIGFVMIILALNKFSSNNTSSL